MLKTFNFLIEKKISIVAADDKKPKKAIRIALISDTYNQHTNITIPQVDILIHAGNFTDDGTMEEVKNFLSWYNQQKAIYKILILGTNEYCLKKIKNTKYFFKKEETIYDILIQYPTILLLNNTWAKILGLTFFGTDGYDSIDLDIANIDVLVTHFPPIGILDKNRVNKNSKIISVSCGSKHVSNMIFNKKIGLHVFGHVHKSAGYIKNDTLFVNASIVKDMRDVNNEYIIPDIDLNDIFLVDIK
jgi:predicted phosphodiesterase